MMVPVMRTIRSKLKAYIFHALDVKWRFLPSLPVVQGRRYAQQIHPQQLQLDQGLWSLHDRAVLADASSLDQTAFGSVRSVQSAHP